MPYKRCCIIPNCGSEVNVIYHCIPRHILACKRWLIILDDLCPDLKFLTKNELGRKRVCQKHFEKRFISKVNRIRLGGYPSLFSVDEIESGIPERVLEDTENVNPNIDHNYHKRSVHNDHNYCSFSDDSPYTPAVRNDCASTDFMDDDFMLPPPSPTTPTGYPGNEHDSAMPTLRDVFSSTRFDDDDDVAMPSTAGQIVNLEYNQNRPKYKDASTSTHPMGSIKWPPLKTTTQTGPAAQDSKLKIYNNKLIKNSKPRCTGNCRRYRLPKPKKVKLSKEDHFNIITKKMAPLTKQFLWMQIQQSTRKHKGRRFTLEEKILGLSIMKQSSKCYRMLKQIFILPTKTTLNKMFANLNVETNSTETQQETQEPQEEQEQQEVHGPQDGLPVLFRERREQ